MRKLCTKCNQEKNETAFRFRNKAKGIRASWCKVCFSEYERHVWSNSKGRRESNQKHNRLRRIRNQRFVWAYLLQHPCEVCGETDPVVLEFDHLDRKSKKNYISDMSRGSWSVGSIGEEIAKCRVLCANCHLRHTSKQMGWYENIRRIGE